MAARALTLIAVAAVVLAVLVLIGVYSRRRRHQAQALPQDMLWAALGTRPDGRATIVDFWTSACGDCKAQAEELKAFTSRDVRVVEVDAGTQLDVARTFGIFSAPSTAVLAPDGRLLGINRRLASHQELQAQLALGTRPAR
ncbi:MAG: thioredoxin family protein [Candidatus Dormibacteraeota bacterium]|nr:thioredoxin family protein [Candidatus Dormibacteraeota bacterium]